MLGHLVAVGHQHRAEGDLQGRDAGFRIPANTGAMGPDPGVLPHVWRTEMKLPFAEGLELTGKSSTAVACCTASTMFLMKSSPPDPMALKDRPPGYLLTCRSNHQWSMILVVAAMLCRLCCVCGGRSERHVGVAHAGKHHRNITTPECRLACRLDSVCRYPPFHQALAISQVTYPLQAPGCCPEAHDPRAG